MITNAQALASLRPGESFQMFNDSVHEILWKEVGTTQPTELEIQNEVARLEALEPLRLLREQRDTIHLPAWDKEVQIKFLNNNLPIPQNYLDWKQAYLDLPQNIAAGTIPAPTIYANGQLIFNGWPVLVP